MKKEITC